MYVCMHLNRWDIQTFCRMDDQKLLYAIVAIAFRLTLKSLLNGELYV